MYKVNKSNNEKRYTCTSDENHCAPEEPTFWTDKLLFFKDKQQNKLFFNIKFVKHVIRALKSAMVLHHSLNKIKLE